MPSFSNHLADLFRYTRWANRLVLAALEDVPETEPMRRAQELLSHLLRAEAIWLGRVHGDDELPGLWEVDALPVCRERMEENARRWLALVQEQDLRQVVRYENSKGKRFDNELREIAGHVVNHSTHHRAQIATLLRQAGREPPATDYIFFARSAQTSPRDA